MPLAVSAFPRAPRARSAALIAAIALAVPSVARAQTERRAVPGDQVAIYNLAGHLRAEGGGSGDVMVEVTRAGRDASKLEVRAGTRGGRHTLSVVYPSDRVVYPELGRGSNTELSVNDDGTFDDNDRGDRERVQIRGSGSGLEAHADLRVVIPRGKSVALHLGAGDVQISNVDGDLRASVGAASITSEHTRGMLTLDTGSGEVRVSDAQGPVSLDTGSGGVTLTGMKGESLRLDTGSGSVHADDVDVRDLVADVGSGGIHLGRTRATRVKLDTGSGGTDIELLSTVDELTIDGGSGGVTVHVPATIGADVDIETGSGGIDTDFPVQVTRYERTHLRGRIGDGHGRIRIESGSGRVQLLKS